MKICPNCGAQLADDAALCTACGASVALTGAENNVAGAASRAESAPSTMPVNGGAEQNVAPNPAQTDGAHGLQRPAYGPFPQQTTGQAPQGMAPTWQAPTGTAPQWAAPAAAPQSPYQAWESSPQAKPNLMKLCKVCGGIVAPAIFFVSAIVALMCCLLKHGVIDADISVSLLRSLCSLCTSLIVIFGVTMDIFQKIAEVYKLKSPVAWIRANGLDLIPYLRENAYGIKRMSGNEQGEFNLMYEAMYNVSCGKNGGSLLAKNIIFVLLRAAELVCLSGFVQIVFDYGLGNFSVIGLPFIIAFVTVIIIQGVYELVFIIVHSSAKKKWGRVYVPEMYMK